MNAAASSTGAPLEFRDMLAGDAVLLELQPSQHYELGLHHPCYTLEEGEDLASNGDAWTAHRGSRIITIAGFRDLFGTGTHAIVWASLSADLGRDYLPITRFAREKIATSRFPRLEAIVDASDERAITWANLVGLKPVHVLRGYGPQSKDHILFERVQ
jgi:hypothetical protein